MQSPNTSKLLAHTDQLISEISEQEEIRQPEISKVDKHHTYSATNLLHYHALRQHDLSDFQRQLGNLGMSRLARAENSVKHHLYQTRHFLKLLLGQNSELPTQSVDTHDPLSILNQRTEALLGPSKPERRVRIMVTLPFEASKDPSIILSMVKSGMSVARINCAHDHPAVWDQMIQNIRNAESLLNEKITILMDLAGPKLRTGPTVSVPSVFQFKPKRDRQGRKLAPAEIRFTHDSSLAKKKNTLITEEDWSKQVSVGMTLYTLDCRGASRKLKIIEIVDDMVIATCKKTCYFDETTTFSQKSKGIPELKLIPTTKDEISIPLQIGDQLKLHSKPIPGEAAQRNSEGHLISPAHISCTAEELLKYAKIGDPIFFDDGTISAEVLDNNGEALFLKITQTNKLVSMLKAEKGINAPNTDLQFGGLTQKDKEDLSYIVKKADVVSYSFVNTAEDVEELYQYLAGLGAPDELGVVLKVETKKAFNNLFSLLMTAMQRKSIGVMIARGDLAIETGWDHIGRVQKEIIKTSTAAHVPVIWATQVLENLAKKGLPSRSEITDVASAIRAECVMLNKGPHIMKAIKLLDTLLRDTEHMKEKNHTLLPKMPVLS